jgi:toxin YoeB
MKIAFADAKAFNSFVDWYSDNRKTAEKIVKIIEDTSRHPTEGIGKPEALTGDLAGFYSRRINDKDRFIYLIKDDEIIITSCKGHYE